MRSVVVTGAARGIGRATASALVRAGWTVVGLDLHVDDQPDDFQLVRGDANDEHALGRALDAARRQAPLGGWVNNVGINHRAPLHLVEPDAVRDMVNTNLVATVLGCQLAVRAFLEGGSGGAIVNVSSIHALAGFPQSAVYDATKGAIEALTRTICVEYGHRGIRCNSVAPGAIDTEASRAMIASSADPATAVRDLRALAVDHRVLSPEEVAAPIVFLLSPEASGINGQRLGVDSGASARCFADPSTLHLGDSS
jgi:NAD(P)-dependent dehydrogenase (short-subunit alcohol dehydrogenase family)